MTLKEYRIKEGLTQSELAKNCECSIQQIQKMEQDPERIWKTSVKLMYFIWHQVDPYETTKFDNFINEISRDAWIEKRKEK